MVAQGARALALQQTVHTDQRGRAAALRERLAVTAANLAATEDEVARVHDALAALRPSRSGEYRRVADEARQGALRARLIKDRFSAG